MNKRINITLATITILVLIYCYWLNITLAKAKSISELTENITDLDVQEKQYQDEYKIKEEACNKELQRIHNNADYVRAKKEELENKLSSLGLKMQR
jgi:hypothetical protein